MMRSKPASSMQKTYDDCYLICSTAVYFESQNNEAEALRSWREALDQIYYHNAYRIPSGWRARSETEKALQDSLKQMELQCKERVELLEALRESRTEKKSSSKTDLSTQAKASTTSLTMPETTEAPTPGWLGDGTVPAADYASISRPAYLSAPSQRTLPKRPSYTSTKSSSNDIYRTVTSPPTSSARLSPVPPNNMPALPPRPSARTPSPEKKSGMLRTLRVGSKDKGSSSQMQKSLRTKPPAAAKAATQAWGRPVQQRSSVGNLEQASSDMNGGSAGTTVWDPYTRSLVDRPPSRDAPAFDRRPSDMATTTQSHFAADTPDTHFSTRQESNDHPPPYPDYPKRTPPMASQPFSDDFQYRSPEQRSSDFSINNVVSESSNTARSRTPQKPTPPTAPKPELSLPSYRKEYLAAPAPRYKKPPNATPPRQWDHRTTSDPTETVPTQSKRPSAPPAIPRKAIGVVAATMQRRQLDDGPQPVITSAEEYSSSGQEATPKRRVRKVKVPIAEPETVKAKGLPSPILTDSDPSQPLSDNPTTTAEEAWKKRVEHVLANLPKGVDEAAAKQIFNEIVIQGDEVHWDDVSGLEIAKSALKETVVYPFLRPDLFMGLREPARGMLLFGPPGTGKTMLARAVATESRSTFFAISASSLTSKYLGESEKLVRALFALAKVLAPSIIFVDEIDSLLSARGGGSEHEATRRIKTEFLIQWSDLAKAAAGRETSDKDKERGDATRVLVLAATNLPWAIDEAARRRFVRRQYIPLPEDWVRKLQLSNLLGAQKHSISERELAELVLLTDGYSGSDITALAKDAAMGPLRSLGERLLDMSPDEIRPIEFQDFQVSLVNIRPSVGKNGLKEYEDWARDFGERGG